MGLGLTALLKNPGALVSHVTSLGSAHPVLYVVAGLLALGALGGVTALAYRSNNGDVAAKRKAAVAALLSFLLGASCTALASGIFSTAHAVASAANAFHGHTALEVGAPAAFATLLLSGIYDKRSAKKQEDARKLARGVGGGAEGTSTQASAAIPAAAAVRTAAARVLRLSASDIRACDDLDLHLVTESHVSTRNPAKLSITLSDGTTLRVSGVAGDTVSVGQGHSMVTYLHSGGIWVKSRSGT